MIKYFLNVVQIKGQTNMKCLRLQKANYKRRRKGNGSLKMHTDQKMC